MTRPAKTALALGKIDLEEKTTDLRLKLKGKLAVDLADYQRAFAQANDQSLELDQLVPHILAAFIDADKGFQAWRKAQPASSEWFCRRISQQVGSGRAGATSPSALSRSLADSFPERRQPPVSALFGQKGAIPSL